MALKDFQKEKNFPSKCGIEVRKYVPALYGGYFYNRSQEEGLDTLEWVKEWAGDIPCYLKRGCTEMEMCFGHSHIWEVTEQSKHWEDMVNHWIDYEPMKIPQVECVENYVIKSWFEFAAEHGDTTYKEFTDGVDLIPSCVTYVRPKGDNDGKEGS
jgi:hypothetical protein